jgi:hypothetical protein
MKHFYIALCIAASLLGGCANFGLQDINKFEKGMSVERVLDVSGSGPREDWELVVAGGGSSKYRALIFDIVMANQRNKYIAAFENGSLIYWGYPYEFMRFPDKKINEIGKAVIKKLD